MIALWIIAALILSFGFVVVVGAPYVPTLSKELSNAFTKLYPVGPNDVVVDLGSGDGKVLVEAAKHGAYGYGYELNPVLVLIAKLRLKRAATIRMADMWHADLPGNTTLVYAFTVSRDTKRLAAYVQAQANAQARQFHVMTFGSQLTTLTPVRTRKAHSLYTIVPTNSTQS